MEENMDIQAAPEAEAAIEAEPLAAEEVPVEEPNEVLPDESQVSEADIPEAGAEDNPAESYGDESPVPPVPQIDPAVYAGWQELAKAHPEVVGKPLPDDIMQACVQSGLPPLRVYESMMLKKQGEQIAALQQEIAALRQNAEAAQRAPVTAASLGGNEGNDPNDEFLRGFNS